MTKTRRSKQCRYFLVGAHLLSFALVSGGCDFIKNIGANEKIKVEEVYKAYAAAIAAGNLEVVKTHLSKERVKEIDGTDAAAALPMIQALYPKGAVITNVKVSGDSATVNLSGPSKEGSIDGVVTLVKQASTWKIDKESWQINITAQEEKPPATTTSAGISRPYEYEKIIGRWKGHEAGQSANDWEFSFASNYVVSVKGPADQRYRGIAMADWDLGADGGQLRVLPGGAIFDLRTFEASEPQWVNQLSLGSFKIMGETLQFCGSRPGLMKRSSEFASSGGIRCFELSKLPGGSEPSVAITPRTSPS